MPRTWCFVLALGARYPLLVAEALVATRLAAAPGAVSVQPAPGCVRLVSYGSQWTRVFPQHRPGRKHERGIELERWQRDAVDAHPQAFLRGLIHSDGCRTINRFKTTLPSGRVAEYEYARYFFSNLSADIRGLFCEYCDRLGIRWTQSNPRNVSVSHRKSVALLDEFVGPKR